MLRTIQKVHNFSHSLRINRNIVKIRSTLSSITEVISAKDHNNTQILNLHKKQGFMSSQIRCYGNPLPPSVDLNEALIDANTYEIVCNETLESLCEYFEELTESDPTLTDADVVYGDGVLTVKLGGNRGTYVINRQSPNRQLWLSSPTSGPKRYDFVPTNDQSGDKCQGYWIYKHDGRTLHELLQEELPKLLTLKVDFMSLLHGSR